MSPERARERDGERGGDDGDEGVDDDEVVDEPATSVVVVGGHSSSKGSFNLRLRHCLISYIMCSIKPTLSLMTLCPHGYDTHSNPRAL